MATFEHDSERLLAALKSENYQAIDAIKKANERRFQIEDFDVSKLVEDPFSTNFVDEEIKSSVFASAGPNENNSDKRVFAVRYVRVFL